jgi:plasmid stabilization system protein ParE
MMILRWTYRARKDLLSIGRYIAEDNPQRAREWLNRLRIRAQKIPLAPLSGGIVPEIGREDLREVIERNYRIVYKIRPDSIDIITVFEGHQLFPLESCPKD